MVPKNLQRSIWEKPICKKDSVYQYGFRTAQILINELPNSNDFLKNDLLGLIHNHDTKETNTRKKWKLDRNKNGIAKECFKKRKYVLKRR